MDTLTQDDVVRTALDYGFHITFRGQQILVWDESDGMWVYDGTSFDEANDAMILYREVPITEPYVGGVHDVATND